jgi:hypothetical protein
MMNCLGFDAIDVRELIVRGPAASVERTGARDRLRLGERCFNCCVSVMRGNESKIKSEGDRRGRRRFVHWDRRVKKSRG